MEEVDKPAFMRHTDEAMKQTILFGRSKQIQELPLEEWKHSLSQVPEAFKSRPAFMTPQHHAVRYFVVKEIVRTAEPIHPQVIAEALRLTTAQVGAILWMIWRRIYSSWCGMGKGRLPGRIRFRLAQHLTA